MKNSFQIAKIFGIPVKLHWTFSLMMAWVVLEGRRNGMDWASVGWFALLVIGLFVCVILHEFGHALSARRFGVGTKDIILSPIGGVARLNRLPEKPIHESIVAAAGPVVNLLIAGVVGGYGWLTSSLDFSNLNSREAIFGNPENFITILLFINIFLAVFNLIPAFPMDGGRIFRSLLSAPLGRRKATQITTYLGQGMAVMIIFFAYYFSPEKISYYLVPLFIISAIFMFFMATRENQRVRFEEILKKQKVSELVRAAFTAFQKSDKMELAMDTLKRGLEKDFLVKNEEGKIEGVLSENSILKNAKAEQDLGIEKFISPIEENIHPSETLFDFYKKMVEQQLHILPVFENEEMVGVVDLQQLNEFLKLQNRRK